MRSLHAVLLSFLFALVLAASAAPARASTSSPCYYTGGGQVAVGFDSHDGNGCSYDVILGLCDGDDVGIYVSASSLHRCVPIGGTCSVAGHPGVYVAELDTCFAAPQGVASCAVAGGYPGQTGVVVQNADGTAIPECFGLASPAQCSVVGVVWNNVPVCGSTCGNGTPGPGWSVGAQPGACVGAPWVAVYPAYPGCPAAATIGVVVYGGNGQQVFSACF